MHLRASHWLAFFNRRVSQSPAQPTQSHVGPGERQTPSLSLRPFSPLPGRSHRRAAELSGGASQNAAHPGQEHCVNGAGQYDLRRHSLCRPASYGIAGYTDDLPALPGGAQVVRRGRRIAGRFIIRFHCSSSSVEPFFRHRPRRHDLCCAGSLRRRVDGAGAQLAGRVLRRGRRRVGDLDQVQHAADPGRTDHGGSGCPLADPIPSPTCEQRRERQQRRRAYAARGASGAAACLRRLSGHQSVRGAGLGEFHPVHTRGTGAHGAGDR